VGADRGGAHIIVCVESRCQHDDVDLVQMAVGGPDTALLIDVTVPLERLVATPVDVRAYQRSIADVILRAYAEDVWEPFVSSKFAEPDFGSLADYASRGRQLMAALLTHLQRAALDDAATSVVLSEVDQAERALDGIKPSQGGRPDHDD
jgi:hypothetical protein